MGQLVLFFWARLSWCCLGPIVHLYPAGWSLGRVLQHGPSCGDWAVLHADSYSRPIWKAIREGQRPRWKHKNLARQQSAGDKVLRAPAEKVPMGTQAPFCPSNLIPWLEIESTFRWEEAVTLKRAWRQGHQYGHRDKWSTITHMPPSTTHFLLCKHMHTLPRPSQVSCCPCTGFKAEALIILTGFRCGSSSLRDSRVLLSTEQFTLGENHPDP